jgi:hypothetical protein
MLPFPARLGPYPKPLPIPIADHDLVGDTHEYLRQARCVFCADVHNHSSLIRISRGQLLA